MNQFLLLVIYGCTYLRSLISPGSWLKNCRGSIERTPEPDGLEQHTPSHACRERLRWDLLYRFPRLLPRL
ncbi:MAG: hypothetical protein HWN65_16875 [Candidatus Helarchaeota archaeon]|nr:hypothetical protein [Candidatus Helarchaeota archaeon]